MGEPITGPASCAYKHSAREEASGRFGGATCKDVVSEPCRETRGRSATKPLKPAAACAKNRRDLSAFKDRGARARDLRDIKKPAGRGARPVRVTRVIRGG